jgi:photosystem II stability/assembly factor-like uncharacterized protein/tetratricopeptide (TPR) repeat protein
MIARILVFTCLGTAVLPRVASAGDPTSIDDATLNAVFFVDENEGWAVGEDGVVLHTIDRGLSWDLQRTPTTDVLTSIQMTGGDDGWIVGRRPTPFLNSTSGTLLGTTDRGIRWMPIDQPGQFTGLNKVRFLDANKGWVLGDASDRSPTGMWFTTDAGRSWATLKSGRQAGWLSAAPLDFNNGILVGQNGALANLRAGSVRPATADVRPGVALRGAGRSGVRTWVVGDRAQVLFSDDAGVSWTRAKLPIPAELRNICDFTAVAAVGDKVWVVGRPGSVVLHSPDAGATWKLQKTGYGMPLKSVHFPTEQVGFAVGAMGALLKTDDGGEHWTATWDPKIGRRAAALFVSADLRDVPLAVVARYGAEQGYYCVGLGMTCPDIAEQGPNAALRPTRQADAFRRAGGVYAETRSLFPLSRDQFNNPVEAILASWDKRLEGSANADFVRDLAMAIRMYRPHVVVMDAVPTGSAEGGVRGLTARMCSKAITGAGDAQSYPELESVFGLTPHNPSVVYSMAADQKKDAPMIVHSASDLGERMGQTYAEVADAALSLAIDEYASATPTSAFSVVAANIPEERLGKDLLSGLSLRPGLDARRKLRVARELTDVERRQIESRKNLMAIAEQGEDIIKPEQALAGLSGATRDLPPAIASQVIFRYGRKYVESGRWDLAASVYENLAQKYPEQALTAEALRWLAAYKASGESRIRFGEKHEVATTEAKVEKKKGGPVANVKNSKADFRSGGEGMRWQNQSLAYLRGLQAVNKDVWGEPQTQLLLASIVRSLGQNDPAKLYYDSILAADPKSRYQRVVQQERWMMFGKPEDPPPAMLLVANVHARPKLDGDLSDECWGSTPSHKLTIGDKAIDGSRSTTIRLRYDDKYLYMAAECKFADGNALKPSVERRTRDGDTTPNDRIEMMVDADRDYMTYFRFRVDQTGQAAEDCWSDPTWNPKWYVATKADATGYTVEMAVPLSEITSDPTKIMSQTWAVNVQRVIPGVGVMAAARPASVEPRPEGFMLMKFEPKHLQPLGQ